MNIKKLTLSRIRNTNISYLYKELISDNKMSDVVSEKILTIAIIMLNDSDHYITNFGYRIILFYSNKTHNYKPLYDVTINKGLIPISKFIQDKFILKDDFFKLFNSSYMENYKDQNIYLTYEQKTLTEEFLKTMSITTSVIAPTSYGKSELIISTLKILSNKNICILVPTKALLSQTKKRILDAKIDFIRKIIIYPEMYSENDINIIAILTQERLLRLLSNNKNLNFDYVFVDEAHNLLTNDSRNMLLASSLSILEKRNKNTIFKFLTPFLIDSSNLKVHYSNYEINEYRITEYVKSEKIYLCDLRNSTFKFYDQFLDELYIIKDKYYFNEVDMIFREQGNKNIIYFNKPKVMEEFASLFSKKFNIVKSTLILKACKDLSKFLHKEYNLIECLSHGIVYHHGAIPNYIRLYIENLFKYETELKFIITNSTLLEGVNIPAEKLFLMDIKKGRSYLNASQLKNLIGRVSRFSEVFSNNNENMNLLEPKIYFITSQYISKNADLDKFIKKRLRVDRNIRDEFKNVLLKNVPIDKKNYKDKKNADEFIANFETNVIENSEIKKVKTILGKRCFSNNITEIDILINEEYLNDALELFQNKCRIIENESDIFRAISEIFIPYIKDNNRYENLKRLKYEESQIFYKMFLNWRIENTPYNKMINSFLNYWKKFDIKDEKDKHEELSEEECLIYVGRWGDEKRNGHLELWTNIRKKDLKERVNLAIVRIYDEMEFLDNVIIKFIEVLNDSKLLNEDFYNKIKYGTSEQNAIILIKNGISYSLASLITSKYPKYLEVSIHNQTYNLDKKILNEMKYNDENSILIFELEFNLNL